MFRLDGKVAIVTGAARGLGAATAAVLAQQGARVAVADVKIAELQQVAKSLDASGKAYEVDVSSVEALQGFVQAVVRDFGRIDILINNAGICPRIAFEESSESDWERLMSVNAKSQYFLCQLVTPVMRRQGGGRIVNIASTGGRIGGFANSSIYSGTKGAIVMFTKSIAREVAKDGILVNCVAPGVLDTDLMRNLPPDRVAALCEQIPLRRLGQPREVAAMIAFLASDENSYATGATFDINGGWVML
jgi:NAD(P)-dependent dehydrogenase (short-subunit alcohol dehydrogenase family)